MSKADVVLVVPPGTTVRGPALGPSLLAASCRERGLSTLVHYANMRFASRAGYALSEQISTRDVHLLLNELIFRPFIGDGISQDQLIRRYFYVLDRYKVPIRRRGAIGEDILRSLFRWVQEFLLEWEEYVKSAQPRIVGFSAMFQQTLASAAMAAVVKRVCPESFVMLGGSNAAGVMGQTISQHFPQFDLVVSGEADTFFPDFCEKYCSTSNMIPGDRFHDCASFSDLDSSPLPDYREYFEQLTACQDSVVGPTQLPNWLHFETSRGCWWGMKNHCTFCGLNALEMAFRRKTPERVAKEINYLFYTYNIEYLHATDNIVPIDFRKRVLPLLKFEGKKPSIFCEMKSNLTEAEIEDFANSGIYMIQPGIESLSNNVLRLMKKGVTGSQNIELLRNARERGIIVSWNLLTGFPGETLIDYHATEAVVPLLEHLQPPLGHGPIRIDRFSPYFEHAPEYGITNLVPLCGYEAAFAEIENVGDLAYHFSGTYRSEFLEDAKAEARLSDLIDGWMEVWKESSEKPRLNLLSLGRAGWLIEDTRRCRKDEFTPVDGAKINWLRSVRRHRNVDQAQVDDPAAFAWAIQRGFVAILDKLIVCLVVGKPSSWEGE